MATSPSSRRIEATLYSHFPSKEELFVECMMAALENYMSDTLKHLDASRTDTEAGFATWHERPSISFASPEQVECVA